MSNRNEEPMKGSQISKTDASHEVDQDKGTQIMKDEIKLVMKVGQRGRI